MSIICGNCNKQITGAVYRITTSNKHYCSMECRNEHIVPLPDRYKDADIQQDTGRIKWER
jgi:hypothetical protein